MVAARARGMYDDAAKQRQKQHGDTATGKTKTLQVNLPEPNQQARDASGKALGVSGKSVDFASKVLDDENRSHQSSRTSFDAPSGVLLP